MATKKVFLAGPFKSLVDEKTGLMSTYERGKLESLISFFENEGWLVHNAHKREGWGKDFMTPLQCTKIDFDEISTCDLFASIPRITRFSRNTYRNWMGFCLEKKDRAISRKGQGLCFLNSRVKFSGGC
nr:hypothetical protein [Bacillus velezensis]